MRTGAVTSWRKLLGVLTAMSACGRQSGGAPAGADAAASAEIVVRPVRNGSADVQYADIHEVFTRSRGATAESLTVRVPEPPPVGPPPAGLEVVAMSDAQGTVPCSIRERRERRERRAPGRPHAHGSRRRVAC